MKLKYEDIKKEVEKESWSLLSTEYVNLKTTMRFLCPNGHENNLTLDYWRRHKECPICKNSKFYKMDNSAPKKKGYRILAFDQATITSGWAVFDGAELIKFGDWTSEGNGNTERIMKTKYWVANMIQTWKPDLIVFEDIQLQKFEDEKMGVLTYKKLAHLQGVLKNYCYENGYVYKIVYPATWREKSKVKGKSRSDRKKSAQLIVKDKYDINVTQDQADAILIGEWAVKENELQKMVIF